MEQMITANIMLDIFSIVLSLIPVVYILNNRRYRQRLNQYFLGVSISNVFMIMGDLADWTLREITTPAQQVTLTVFSVIFYVASAFVLYFFARYMEEYLKLSGRARTWYLRSVRFVCLVQIFFAAVSPFTGAIFTVTETGYQRGGLFLISQLVPLYCYLLFTATVIHCRKRLTRREVIFFLLYIFVPLGGGAAQMFLRGIAVVNIGVSLALLFILVNIQFEYEVRLREQEKELAEQHINMMLSQIQPHFLYNSLGAIYQLCETDPALAKASIRKFSDFLRGNMDSLKAHEPIPFEKELNHVMNFLYLEQQRFGEQLRIVYQIETSDFFIPPLTLQPLVENAVQHGILHKKEGGTIIIRTEEKAECAVVTILDDGVGMERARQIPNLGDHAHIGISNVRSRLEEMVHGSLEIESSGQGTIVTIQIPW